MASKLYDFTVRTADGKEKNLGDYRGRVLLIVNVASKCGYTPQYKDLEAVFQKYRQDGFSILAFPSNDFGGQEPGTMEEIRQFCTTNYGVTFDLFEKVHAIGEEIHPLYQWLSNTAEPAGDVKWNFEKFLIDKEGGIIGRYVSKVSPLDSELTEAVEKALQA